MHDPSFQGPSPYCEGACDRAPPKLCPHMGECDSTTKENLMPELVPPAQGDRATRSRPGSVGGVVLRAAAEASPSAVGQDVEVDIEDVAQGGWCVARPDGLPVMFVRHALPGERVVARVTDVPSKFARADAVTVLRASP